MPEIEMEKVFSSPVPKIRLPASQIKQNERLKLVCAAYRTGSIWS